jgi:hypothetical protein
MSEPWETNVQVAKQIFQFFRIDPTSTENEDFIHFEGELGGRILVLGCSKENLNSFTIEYRNEEGVYTDALLIDGCKDLHFDEDPKDQNRAAVIGAKHGIARIETTRLIATISSI